MSISINPLMHTTIAQSIYNNVLSKSSKYFYFLGKTTPYALVNGIEQIEEAIPTYKFELSTRKDIITFKEITNNDISFVIPRINWVSNEVYDHYDDNYSVNYLSYSGASSISESKFYVFVDETNLYICLDSNNNSVSTVKPSGNSELPFSTGDGYKWKFIMTVPPALKVKFLTSFYIPVTTAVNNIFYNNGALDSVVINNSGTSYPSASVATTITVTGAGTGASLSPRVSASGEITSVDIISGGTGYVLGTTTLTVVGSGTGKFSPNIRAMLTPVIVGGVISFVSIDDPGASYSTPITTLTVTSDTGTGAALTPIVQGGQIVDVIIDQPGVGYKAAKITASGTGGSGATFTVSTSGGQLNTTQANVELLSVDGTIDYIQVENKGSGYTSITITISGDGQGATASAVISSGQLVKINITNRGSGYTYATVSVVAVGTTPTSVASARAIMSPRYGHGKNAISQLFSDTLMLYSTISNSNTSGFVFNNDYRQFGIIRNPTKFDSTQFYNDILGTACYITTGTTIGTLVNDLILSDTSGNSYTVISVTTNTKILLQPNTNSTPVIGQVLTNGAITFTIVTLINPTVDKYSGDLLYIDSRTSFYQTEDQTVTLQTILKF